MGETTEPVDNRAQETMHRVYLELGFLAGALDTPQVFSLIQTGVQEDARFKGHLTFLRDKLNAALADELPRVQH